MLEVVTIVGDVSRPMNQFRRKEAVNEGTSVILEASSEVGAGVCRNLNAGGLRLIELTASHSRPADCCTATCGFVRLSSNGQTCATSCRAQLA